MNFGQLQARANVIASFEGWTEVNPPPDWFALVNQAYIEFAWDAECVYDVEQILTVADQAEYPTAVHVFKSFTDVWYDTDGPKKPLCKSSVRRERSDDPRWYFRPSGMPETYSLEVQSKLRVTPAPSTANVKMLVRGVVEPDPLVNLDDDPVIPSAYHEGIACGAVYLHAYIFAPDKALRNWAIREQHVARYRKHLAPSRSARESRNVEERFGPLVALR